MSSEGSCGPAAGRAAPPPVLEEAFLPSGDPFPGGSDPQTCGGWFAKLFYCRPVQVQAMRPRENEDVVRG